jgi:predicted nuclease of restriction endonuclease-like RecB superfamily
VCVPDLVFTSRETGEEVFFEAFGFWSRAAVWKRVELLRKGFPARILLVVGKQLRVSEEVLSDEDAGEIYVYKRTISPREVLERLDRPAQKAAKASS